MASTPRITPEEYLALPDHDRFELVDGHLVEVNMSKESSWVGGELYGRLRDVVKRSDLGYVWPADNLYRCFPSDPAQIRKPDVSFIRRERMNWDQPDEGFVGIAPDLVAEVVSPNDLAYEIDEKVEDYLEAGVRLVWVVHPLLRMIRVHRADGSITVLSERENLTGEDVILGFVCPVAALFPTTTKTPSQPPVGAND
ncbi:MAG: Uma2 family endonuclease [Isosphaeraceae bacterium]|nr:Uma2 family endonuclease [Isosphaeraceae bacterium]